MGLPVEVVHRVIPWWTYRQSWKNSVFDLRVKGGYSYWIGVRVNAVSRKDGEGVLSAQARAG